MAVGLALGGVPAVAQTGYDYDYDYEDQGDDWYGRPGAPDPRRDYDAFSLDLVSAGDDFGAGYEYVTDVLDKLIPLTLTQQRHSVYVFRFGSLGSFTHFAPGTVSQVLLGKLSGNELMLSWTASCAVTDTNYAIYRATIPNFTSYSPLDCSTGGDTFATIPAPSGSVFYLIVPNNGVREGSYGSATSGERPASAIECFTGEPAQCF